MLTPLEPNAGPTGGAGLAFPALRTNFTIALNFFEMNLCHFITIVSFYVISTISYLNLVSPIIVIKAIEFIYFSNLTS